MRLTAPKKPSYTDGVDTSTIGTTAVVSGDEPVTESARSPWQAPKSRANEAEERTVLAYARTGKSEEALEILVRVYSAPLNGFALRVVRNRELAEDICQQVFLEAFQGLDRFEGRGSVWSWLCGIARHRCLDELRRRKRGGPASEDPDQDFERIGGTTAADPDADRVARLALDHCLGNLQPAMRIQVLMRYFLGLSFVEIGKELGEPAGTVQVRISRILPRLQHCLRGKGVSR